jgi:hypothetical protein
MPFHLIEKIFFDDVKFIIPNKHISQISTTCTELVGNELMAYNKDPPKNALLIVKEYENNNILHPYHYHTAIGILAHQKITNDRKVI